MAHKVIMPRQGQSVESCILTRWYKEKGEKVAEGDLLFSFETDKAAFEEEAKSSGYLLQTYFNVGDEVPVLATVAVIGEEDEDPGDVSDESPQQESEEKQVESNRRVEEKPVLHKPLQHKPQTPEAVTDLNPVSPRAKKRAIQKGIDYTMLKGSGPGGRIVERDIIAAEEQQLQLTPLAKAKLKERGQEDTDLNSLPAPSFKQKRAIKPQENDEFRDSPLSRMRKLIADNMHRSLNRSAQLTHHTHAGAERILAIRKKIKPMAKTHKIPDITLNDLVCFAAIRTLEKHPAMNGHFLDEVIRSFKPVHLGMAVDTERGLMVPVVKNADSLSLSELALSMKEMAEGCRSGSINPDLLLPEAASFTVTNLGQYGIEYFTPVLNLPQIAILGVNNVRFVPKPGEGGKVEMVPVIGYSLTYDHRAIDGAPASRFLQDLCLETENLVTGMKEIDG